MLPILVVAPTGVKPSWLREFGKFWPEARVEILRGSAEKRRRSIALIEAGEADVLVAHSETLRHHSRLAPYGSLALTDAQKRDGELNRVRRGTVIADEAHRAKDPKSQQTRALWALAHGESVTHRLCLTGTPLANSPADLWAVLHTIDPKEWPSKTRFLERYCLTAWNGWGGMDIIGFRPEHLAEFRAGADPHMRRMPKALVLQQLPPIVRETRTVAMAPRQATAYAEMLKGMITQLDDGEHCGCHCRHRSIDPAHPVRKLVCLDGL